MSAIRRGWPLLGLLWLLLVCYPNPWILVRNLLRYADFPVDSSIAGRVPFAVPKEPAAIERAVLEQVRYEYDWRQHGVPWYVPTPAEVVASGRSDCEGRAMLLASLLAARGIPYRLKASAVHIWVDYPGKEPNRLESDALAIMRQENGRYRFRWPSVLRLREDLAAQREALWDAMPATRRGVLLAGWAALAAVVLLPWQRRATPGARLRRRASCADNSHDRARTNLVSSGRAGTGSHAAQAHLEDPGA